MLAIKNDIADKIIPIAADWKANDWLIANTYLQDRILKIQETQLQMLEFMQ